MYQREFNQLIQKSLPKALLLYGEDDYQIDYYLEYFVSKLDAKDSMLTMYFDEYDFDSAKSFLSQTSLFGGTNLLVIKNDKKLPKKELDTLIALANKDPSNYFMFIFGGEAKDAKSMQSSFSAKNSGVWVRFFEPNFRDSIALLQQKAQQIELDIDHYALQHLLTLLNNNLSLCANELDKLAILESKITSKDIDRLVYSTAPLAIESLLIDMFNKKPITDTISKLLEFGEDEFSLLRSLQFFVNQLFLFHAYIKLNGTVNSTEILGYKLPKQIEEQKASLALRVKSSALLKIYEELLSSELAIKSASPTQREVLIYSLFIKIQQLL
jgi:DNA polymerase-3 subunit delta